MQTKFIRGPWHIKPFMHNGRLSSVDVCSPATALRPYGAIVATAFYADNEEQQNCYVATADEAMANAALLAAAPAMYEALKLAAQSPGFQYMTHETRAAIDAALAAAIEYTPAQEVT